MADSSSHPPKTASYSARATDVDVYVGKRLRRRRRLMGFTQQQLAELVGVKFQQIQKYESGANCIIASRLNKLATVLEVKVSYFFDGVQASQQTAAGAPILEEDVLDSPEFLTFAKLFLGLSPRDRLRLMETGEHFAKSNSL